MQLKAIKFFLERFQQQYLSRLTRRIITVNKDFDLLNQRSYRRYKLLQYLAPADVAITFEVSLSCSSASHLPCSIDLLSQIAKTTPSVDLNCSESLKTLSTAFVLETPSMFYCRENAATLYYRALYSILCAEFLVELVSLIKSLCHYFISCNEEA